MRSIMVRPSNVNTKLKFWLVVWNGVKRCWTHTNSSPGELVPKLTVHWVAVVVVVEQNITASKINKDDEDDNREGTLVNNLFNFILNN